MRNRVENLGDYNIVRTMLQDRNGNLDTLINDFKNIGAREALPKQVGIGVLIGALILVGGQYTTKKVSDYVDKCKKEKEERETELKKDLKNTLVADGEEDVIQE